MVRTETYLLVITDVFGNELRSINETYASTKSYDLPLRRCALTNALGRLGKYVIAQDGGNEELEGYISSHGQEYIYLFDGEYDVGYEPINVKISDNSYYLALDHVFVVSSTSNAIVLNAGIINVAGGGTDISDLKRTMTLFIVGISVAMVVLLAFVVVKDSIGNVVSRGYAKVRGREHKSKEDKQVEISAKGYELALNRFVRKQQREKEEARKKDSSGVPEAPVFMNDDYWRKYGKK